MSNSKELDEIEKFENQIKTRSLGALVDQLILLRIEDLQSDEDDSITDKSKRTLYIKALKQEISTREVGKKEEGSSAAQGVRSLGGLV